MSATAVREKRQTTIPADVAEAAGIEPGDQVEWRFEEGEIRGRKLVMEKTRTVGLDDVDPRTLRPKGGWKVDRSRLKEAIKAGRDRE
ncbi:MAG TPA: AbrB/MazE/SpoVT family DNA-binding domain-containing protein [Verrucomicrobiae bacterium]